MTGQRMIDLLGFRLEDTAAKKFGIEVRLDVLNDSQLALVNMLHNDLLTELQEMETALSTTDGSTIEDDYYELTGLANDIARNGLVNARIAASGKYFNIIKAGDVKQTENTYLTGSDDYPVGYVWKNRFYVRTTTNTPSIDLWYIKKPSDIKFVFTTDGVASGAAEGTYSYVVVLTVDTLTPLTSSVNNFYNGAVLYNKTNGFNAIVYDYVGSSKEVHIVHQNETVTAGAFVVGRTYRIVSTGTTDFTLIGSADSSVHTIFTATGVGTGTGTASIFAWDDDDEFYFVKGPGSNEKLGDYECELNDSYHEIVIDLAESTLFKMVSDMTRSDKAVEKAMSQINILNQRAETEAAAGIGTTARGN